MRIFALELPAEFPSQSVLEGLHTAVDAETSARAKRFRLKEDALRCLSGRLLVIWYIRTILQCNEEIKIERTDQGRPFLARPDLDIDFNISHDGIYILLAVTYQVGARVGVDVTKIYAPVEALEIEEALEDQLHPFEKTTLRTLPATKRAEHLATIWALKEAYTKALGLGLGFDFSQLKVSDTLAVQGWQFRHGRLKDFMWACATDEVQGLGSLDVERLSFDQMLASVGMCPCPDGGGDDEPSGSAS